MSVSLQRRTSAAVQAKRSFEPVTADTRAIASKIIDDVKTRGEVGLLENAVRLGDIASANDTYVLDRAALKEAFESLPADQQRLLERIAARITAFAEAQRRSVAPFSIPVLGGRAGQTVAPVARAGCYAPGGRYPLPSSVLMTACTARAAGVQSVLVASPRPAHITKAAAYVGGADALVCIGGAQAIAAFAFGAGNVPAVDVIVGPGNKFVTAAKQLVSGVVGIDMLAGPSELLVVADAHADPQTIAADLLAQAEHDTEAVPVLIAIGAPDVAEAIVQRVEAELARQLATLPTAATARAAVDRNGYAVVAQDLDEAVVLANQIASEHLELLIQNAPAVSERFINYGGLFVGNISAEVFGDYGVGPNHTLPTAGTARYAGGLSVFNFLRVRTFLELDENAAGAAADEQRALVADSAALARLEGLEGHARSAERRIEVIAASVSGGAAAAATEKSIDPMSLIRADFPRLDTYTPVKPLHVLAEEIGVPVDQLIKLDANENLYGPDADVWAAMRAAPLHIYPDPESSVLRAALAAHLRVPLAQLVCGCGSDELLDLVMRVFEPDAVVTCSPTFGMYRFLALINHARLVDVPRCGEPTFALDVPALIAAVRAEHGRRAPVVFLASPNNPTGGAVSEAELRPLLAERCVVVVDEAYAEFASTSALALLGEFKNLIVMRTFSKWAGLAGLRVGYAVAHAPLVAALVQIKQPYNINVCAEAAATVAVQQFARVHSTSIAPMINERARLLARLADYAWLRPCASDANFVLCRVLDRPARSVERVLRARGILVRCYAGGAQKVLDNYIRVSCGRPRDTDALLAALDELDAAQATPKRVPLWASGLARWSRVGNNGRDVAKRAPLAILWDMDGVLADVSTSYRTAIIQTAASFGVAVTGEHIRAAKHAGDANNDWVLTQRLCIAGGADAAVATLDEVTRRFQALYKGDASTGRVGLEASERLIPRAALLRELKSAGVAFAVVTGRPRAEALTFLRTHALEDVFGADRLVCMGEAERPKPDGAPVVAALRLLGLYDRLAASGGDGGGSAANASGVASPTAASGDSDYVYMIGDTVDDVRAALRARARVVPLGVNAPNDDSTLALYEAGAARVLIDLEELRALCGLGGAGAAAAASSSSLSPSASSSLRTASLTRATSETHVECSVNLDGTGVVNAATGLGFFDHMVCALGKHSKIDISLQCRGDLHVDDHHSVEDCALVLGACIDKALGDKRGIRRYGSAYAPLDEALARAVIDFSGRPSAVVECAFARERVGAVSTEMLTHALHSLAVAARCTLHVDVLRGANDHHRSEAAFKAVALALRAAVARDAVDAHSVPSTKGAL